MMMVLLVTMLAIAWFFALPLAVAAADEGSCPQWGSVGPISSIGHRRMSIPGLSDANPILSVDIWYPAIDDGENATQYVSILPPLPDKYLALDDPAVASPTGDDGFPLLIFSHGFLGMPQMSASLMEHLVSWGYVVASPQHVDAMDMARMQARPPELSLVIDAMLSPPLVDEFHLEKNVERGVGVIGYSIGAWASLITAAQDPRVRSVLPIVPNRCLTAFDCGLLPKVTAPALMIATANDTQMFTDFYNEQSFGAVNGLPRWNMIVRGGDHLDFSDLCRVFDIIVEMNGEDAALAFIGQGDVARGRMLLKEAHCVNFDGLQTIMRYYATSFFRATLPFWDDDGGRDAATRCMGGKADDFDLLMRLELLEEGEGGGDEAEEGEAEEGEGEGDAAEEDEDVAEDAPNAIDDAGPEPAPQANDATCVERRGACSVNEDCCSLRCSDKGKCRAGRSSPKEQKEEYGEGEDGEEGEEEQDEDGIDDGPDATDSESEVASIDPSEEGGEGKDEADEGAEEEEEAEENEDVAEGSLNATGGESPEPTPEPTDATCVERRGACSVDEDCCSLRCSDRGKCRAPRSSPKKQEKEHEEGEEGRDEDGIDDGPDETDGKSEAASRSSAEEEDEGSCAQWGSLGPVRSVGHRTFSIAGLSAANENVAVHIWYPAIDNGENATQYVPILPPLPDKYLARDGPAVASPSGSGGYPLLIFSHGFLGMPQMSASLMEHLVSWGYVVASPQHVDAMDMARMQARPAELSLVIDAMLSPPFVEEFYLEANVERGVGVIGYSIGAWTSLVVAAQDPRVRSVLPIVPNRCLTAWDCTLLPDVTVPALMIATANDTQAFTDFYNERSFGAITGLPRWNMIVRGGDHLDFSDLCYVFDIGVEMVGRDAALAFIGQGDITRGKMLLKEAHCVNFDELQTIMRYYATSFFRATLPFWDDDGTGRDAAMQCMAEGADDFDLLMRLEFLEEGEEEEGGEDVTESESEVASRSSAEEEDEEDKESEVASRSSAEEEDEEDKEEEEGEVEDTEEEAKEKKVKEDRTVEEGGPKLRPTLNGDDPTPPASPTTALPPPKPTTPAEEDEVKEDRVVEEGDKAEEDKDGMEDSSDATDSKSEVVSKSSVEEEEEEFSEEEEEGEEDVGEEEEDKAEEDNAEEDEDGIKGSSDVTGSRSDVAFASKSTSAAFSTEQAALAQLLVFYFSVVCTVWYQ